MRGSVWLIVLLALAGCTRHKTARRPVQMVAMPPPAEAPHAASSVPVGGAASFDADEVISCEANPAGLVRAYATKESLTLIGEAAGQTTVHLRLSSGDEFYLDMDVTNEPIDYRVLTIGAQVALPLEGVKDITPTSQCVRATKNADGTQLFVLGVKACTALLGFSMADGTTKTIEVVVVGGDRLL